MYLLTWLLLVLRFTFVLTQRAQSQVDKISDINIDKIFCETDHDCAPEEVCSKLCLWFHPDSAFVGCKIVCVKRSGEIGEFDGSGHQRARTLQINDLPDTQRQQTHYERPVAVTRSGSNEYSKGIKALPKGTYRFGLRQGNDRTKGYGRDFHATPTPPRTSTVSPYNDQCGSQHVVCAASCRRFIDERGCNACRCAWHGKRCHTSKECDQRSELCDLGGCVCRPGFEYKDRISACVAKRYVTDDRAPYGAKPVEKRPGTQSPYPTATLGPNAATVTGYYWSPVPEPQPKYDHMKGKHIMFGPPYKVVSSNVFDADKRQPWPDIPPSHTLPQSKHTSTFPQNHKHVIQPQSFRPPSVTAPQPNNLQPNLQIPPTQPTFGRPQPRRPQVPQPQVTPFPSRGPPFTPVTHPPTVTPFPMPGLFNIPFPTPAQLNVAGVQDRIPFPTPVAFTVPFPTPAPFRRPFPTPSALSVPFPTPDPQSFSQQPLFSPINRRRMGVKGCFTEADCSDRETCRIGLCLTVQRFDKRNRRLPVKKRKPSYKFSSPFLVVEKSFPAARKRLRRSAAYRSNGGKTRGRILIQRHQMLPPVSHVLLESRKGGGKYRMFPPTSPRLSRSHGEARSSKIKFDDQNQQPAFVFGIPRDARTSERRTAKQRFRQRNFIRIAEQTALRGLVRDECMNATDCGNQQQCCLKQWCDYSFNCGMAHFCLANCQKRKTSQPHRSAVFPKQAYIDIVYDVDDPGSFIG